MSNLKFKVPKSYFHIFSKSRRYQSKTYDKLRILLMHKFACKVYENKPFRLCECLQMCCLYLLKQLACQTKIKKKQKCRFSLQFALTESFKVSINRISKVKKLFPSQKFN